MPAPACPCHLACLGLYSSSVNIVPFLLPAILSAAAATQGFARGAGARAHEAGGGESAVPAPLVEAPMRDDSVNIQRTDDGANVSADDGTRSADAQVTREDDGAANVSVRTANGAGYDATVVGPEGFHSGYVWRDGNYVAVDLNPGTPYLAPYGAWAGWAVVTQPDYVAYPVYSTYPVETAVEAALQKIGLYGGTIDGLAASCAGAIEQYQLQNGMPVTGTISPELLTALGIQATFQ